MTIEEAMHELKIQSQVLESMILYNKDFEPKNDNTSLENKKNAIDIGIKALEKQIPKKPTYEGDGYWYGQLVYDTWVCPNCGKGYEVDYDNYDHCPDCGQAIDWSGENVN